MAVEMNLQDILAGIAAQQTGVAPAPPVVPGTVPPAVGTAVPTPEGSILGLTPQQFSVIAGGIASALAPPDTWQARLGNFASKLARGEEEGKRTGTAVTGAELKPKAADKPKKSKLDTTPDLSNTLLGV